MKLGSLKRQAINIGIIFCGLLSNELQADVELICPCNYESNGPTSAIVTAGIRNNGMTTSGDLRVRVWGQPDPRNFNDAFLLGSAPPGFRLLLPTSSPDYS